MVIVAAVWNLYVLSTRPSVTVAGLRQVVVPGVLLGLNLATFFVGATHDGVASRR